MGKVLITGGHAGLGLSCSHHLAAGGETHLILAGRSADKMKNVANDLRARYSIAVDLLQLDVSSLASVREAAVQCKDLLSDSGTEGLDAIILNAGGQFRGRTFTDEGYDLTFATNVLGNFLLVESLLECLKPDGRIIFVSSGTHDPETMDGKLAGKAVLPDAKLLAKDSQNLAGGVRYTTSKLCAILTAYELHRRLKGIHSNIVVIAYDPGAILDTDFLRFLPKPAQWLSKTSLMKFMTVRLGITQGSLEHSGLFLAQLAKSERYMHCSGKYYQSSDGKLIEQKSSQISYDEQLSRTLWHDMSNLVGLVESHGTGI